MGCVINSALQPLYTRERPGTHCIGGWVGPRLTWTGAEKLASTGIRSPDSQARSEYLYQLSYPGRNYEIDEKLSPVLSFVSYVECIITITSVCFSLQNFYSFLCFPMFCMTQELYSH
jgi:hypothetical protein